MVGRQPSSYVYPRLWTHVELLGHPRSARALKKLRNVNGFKVPYGTQFSNRLLETKFVPERPMLLDYSTACDVVSLIGYHLKENGHAVKSIPDEIARFDHRIVGLSSILQGRASEHVDPVGDLAWAAGVNADVIAQAIDGRLLPREICNAIVSLVPAGRALDIVQVVPGRGGTPCNGPSAVGSILSRLAR